MRQKGLWLVPVVAWSWVHHQTPRPRLGRWDSKRGRRLRGHAKNLPVPIELSKIPQLSPWRRTEKSVQQQETKKGPGLQDVGATMVRYAWTEAGWASRSVLVVALLALTASKALSVSVPFALQRGVDALVAGDSAKAAGALIYYCTARCLVAAASEVRALCYAFSSQQATRRYASRLFLAMHDLGPSFHATRPTGLLATAFGRGARGFQTLLGQLLFSVVPTFIELGLSAAVLARRFGADVGVLALTTFGLYAWWTAKIVDVKVRVRRTVVDLDNAKTAYLVDSLASHEAVKMLDAKKIEVGRFDMFLRRMVTAFVSSSRVGSVLNLGQALIFATGLCVALLKVAGTATVGDVVAVNALLLQCAVPMNFLGYTVTEIRQSLVDMAVTQGIISRHDSLLKSKPPPEPLPQTFSNVNSPPALVMKNVAKTFDRDDDDDYSPQQKQEDTQQQQRGRAFVALKNCTFTAPAGSVTVLAGSSGSGKSTALRLAASLDTTTSGDARLYYGNSSFPVATLPTELGAKIAFVPQEPSLFDETAWLNVRYGDLNATEDDVFRALREANVDLAQLPDGPETRVGERGQQISGGQKQRLAIARALLSRPNLVLADEPTSGLDAITEREVLKALVGRDRSRTLVVVAHRLPAVAPLADHIVVFKDGAVVQAGAHADLLHDTHGEYFSLWTAAVHQGSQDTASSDPDLRGLSI